MGHIRTVESSLADATNRSWRLNRTVVSERFDNLAQAGMAAMSVGCETWYR